MIRAQVLTGSSGDDAKTGLEAIRKTKNKLVRVISDSTYDAIAVLKQPSPRGTRVVVPPTRTAFVSGGKPRIEVQGRTIQRVAKVGRRSRKKELGYHRRGRVENTLFRYKSMPGDRPYARGLAAQRGCNGLQGVEPTASLGQALVGGHRSLEPSMLGGCLTSRVVTCRPGSQSRRPRCSPLPRFLRGR